MAILILTSGDEGKTIPVSGAVDWLVYGTSSVDMVELAAGVSATVNGGAGQDVIKFLGSNSDYNVKLSGSSAIFTHIATGKAVSVPVTSTGDSISFSGAAAVDLKSTGSMVMLGGQAITTTATIVTASGTGATAGTGTTTNFHTSVTGVDSASLLTTQSSIVKALNGSEKWTSTALTYSFDATRPSDYTGVSVNSTTSGNLTTGWQPLSATLSTLASEIISSIDKLVQLSFSQTSANGDIRFSQVPTTNSVAAFAYFPGTTPSYSGDVFIDTAIDTSTLGAGGYGQLTITHELGHALGLKHPFEDGATLPTADDKHSNTLMSYTDYQNLIPVFTSSGSSINVNYQQIYPDRFMVYDIATLQAIYGADTTTQTGNTTYQYGTSPFYASLWDAGGVDTLDLSATTASNTVDLVPGHYSSINTRSVSAQAQEQKQITPSFDKFIDGVYSQQSNSIYTGTKNLGIAYGSDVQQARSVLLAVAEDSRVLRDPSPQVVVTALGDSAINLSLRLWVNSPDYWPVLFAFTEQAQQRGHSNDNSKVVQFIFQFSNENTCLAFQKCFLLFSTIGNFSCISNDFSAFAVGCFC